jgi:hypothetical protein
MKEIFTPLLLSLKYLKVKLEELKKLPPRPFGGQVLKIDSTFLVLALFFLDSMLNQIKR